MITILYANENLLFINQNSIYLFRINTFFLIALEMCKMEETGNGRSYTLQLVTLNVTSVTESKQNPGGLTISSTRWKSNINDMPFFWLTFSNLEKVDKRRKGEKVRRWPTTMLPFSFSIVLDCSTSKIPSLSRVTASTQIRGTETENTPSSR